MLPRPFLLRLILPFAAMLLLIFVVCGSVLYWAGQRSARVQQIENLDRLNELVHQWLPPGTRAPDESQRQRLTELARVLGTRITLVAGDGEVVFDTDPSSDGLPNHNDRPEIRDARRHGVGSSVRYSTTVAQHALYLAKPLDSAHPDGTVVRLSFLRQALAGRDVPLGAILVASIIASLGIIVMLALQLQRGWIAPLRNLARAAEQMAAGRWHVRVPQVGSDDLKYFTTRLNSIASQAEQQLADLVQQRSDLQALVDTLPDPIIATDAEQRIALLNRAAVKLLQVAPQQAMGQKLVSVVSERAILELYEKAAHPRAADGEHPDESAAGEIRIVRGPATSTYQAVARRTAAGGVLLVLRNVSTMAAAIQMKTDFVANASHELRTPIAAIKIAFETLREVHTDDPAQAERCIGIIDGHLRRLEEMLRDLLDLSRVESHELKPLIAEVQVSELFATLRASLGPMARQKDLALDLANRLDPGRPFHSDVRLLNLVLKNLVENSIKYTPTGGKVTVALEEADDHSHVRLVVADTGVGIAPEHIDRVFERFYQVDPARSGSAGRGTGLGLAIVKHAVAALGGSITLDSALDTGTTVTCRFPRPLHGSRQTAGEAVV